MKSLEGGGPSRIVADQLTQTMNSHEVRLNLKLFLFFILDYFTSRAITRDHKGKNMCGHMNDETRPTCTQMKTYVHLRSNDDYGHIRLLRFQCTTKSCNRMEPLTLVDADGPADCSPGRTFHRSSLDAPSTTMQLETDLSRP